MRRVIRHDIALDKAVLCPYQSWKLAEINELPYKTSLLKGRWEIGEAGIRVFGALCCSVSPRNRLFAPVFSRISQIAHDSLVLGCYHLGSATLRG